MRILGISAYYHNSAAALLSGDQIIAAAEEERFTRVRHDPNFPAKSIAYCLSAASVPLSAIDRVVYYEKPFLKFERILETYLAFAPRGFGSFRRAMPMWLTNKLFQRRELVHQLNAIDPQFDPSRLLFSEHHLGHAASAFYPSPFENALVLTLDGVGEWTTTSAAIGRRTKLTILKEIAFPHSLGLFYSAFTYHAGFRVNSGEYKLMGLAAYGKPVYVQKILDNLIGVKPDGSFRLHMKFFNYGSGLTMTNSRFDDLFGGPPRSPEDSITERHCNMAASVQAVLEEVVLRLVRSLTAKTGDRKLCMAGGVALNCVMNRKLLESGIIEDLWIQPAAGDAGGALGAALTAYYQYAGTDRSAGIDRMAGALLGPGFDDEEIARRLDGAGAVYDVCLTDELLRRSVAALVNGATLGWFQGRMEYGPRALGNRSILADPRSASLREWLNRAVKSRESFRPFGPAVLREESKRWFTLDRDSPYMLLVADCRDPGAIPAVTHVDGSARVQTVEKSLNPLFYSLIERFGRETGCPMLVNTSFNVRGEPIVCTPEDAFACFLRSGLDALAIGNCFLRKSEQTAQLSGDAEFPPD